MKNIKLSCALLFSAAAFGGSLIQQETREGGLAPSFAVTPARAYSTLGEFADSITAGGGGGRYFTGSRRDGFTCGVCHVSNTYFGIEVRGLGESIEPGKTYDLTIAWEGEAERVTFSGEIVGPKGFAVGKLGPVPEDGDLTLAEKKDKRQPFNASQNEARSKSEVVLKWTAPDKRFEGPISVHIAALRMPKFDPDADPQPTAFEGTEQGIFSAVLPFGGTSSTKEAKQGDED